jgi:hypothetical protein
MKYNLIIFNIISNFNLFQMTHDFKRGHWVKEGALTMLTGFLFGATNTIVGHPFDTVKTKMQAQAEHMKDSAGMI